MPLGEEGASLQMKEIKLIIFDLDGTLIDAYQAIAKSFNFTMQSLKTGKYSPKVIRRAVGWGDENLLRPFVGSGDLQQALFIYRKHHKQSLVKYSRLLPGVKKVLGLLKVKGYRLAVASNRPTRFSRILIRHLKLNKYFDYILCADKCKHMKPHPEILQKIMGRFQVKPSQTLYVGDMAIDAEAAHRAKARAIIVTTGSSAKKEIKKEKPFLIIGRITGLLEVL